MFNHKLAENLDSVTVEVDLNDKEKQMIRDINSICVDDKKSHYNS